MASSSNSPCAACKFLRRKCQRECVFAPYFPPDQPQKFANVHKVFGASNVAKLLNELHPHQRDDAVNSLASEADMRLRDPVYGCVGVISRLQMDLSCAKSELSKYQKLGITVTASSRPQQQPPHPTITTSARTHSFSLVAMASSSNSRCAACKFLRRKCQPECVFAPYFPPDQPQKFANVHKVFGASNVTKLLNELHPHQREDAVNSLASEADMHLHDPVYGCVGVISRLQMDLSCAKSELSKYQNLGIIVTASSWPQQQPPPPTITTNRTSEVGINLIGGGGDGGGGRDHLYHHQFFPKDHQQQVIRGFDGTNNHDASLLAMNVSASIGLCFLFFVLELPLVIVVVIVMVRDGG